MCFEFCPFSEFLSKFYDILVNMKTFRLTHRQTKLNTIHDFNMNLKTKQMKSLVKRCTYLDLSKQYCSQHTSASLGHIPVNSVQFSLAMPFVRHLFLYYQPKIAFTRMFPVRLHLRTEPPFP